MQIDGETTLNRGNRNLLDHRLDDLNDFLTNCGVRQPIDQALDADFVDMGDVGDRDD
jgi:hypothetical protein